MDYQYYNKLSMIFVGLLLSANTIGNKPLAFGDFILPAGLLIFPLTYLVAAIITEVYGYKNARNVIWTALFCNLFLSLASFVVIQLPAAQSFEHVDAYNLVLGRTSKIMLISTVTYFIGELVNTYLIARLKVKMNGRNFFLRAIVGTWVGEGLETLLFVPLAFYSDLVFDELIKMLLFYYMFKTIYSFICMPFVSIIVTKLKRSESHTNLVEII